MLTNYVGANYVETNYMNTDYVGANYVDTDYVGAEGITEVDGECNSKSSVSTHSRNSKPRITRLNYI